MKATFDGYLYRGILANMGTGCYVIGVRKDIRQAIAKKIGDKVNVTLVRDTEERIIEISLDLKDTLASHSTAKKSPKPFLTLTEKNT